LGKLYLALHFRWMGWFVYREYGHSLHFLLSALRAVQILFPFLRVMNVFIVYGNGNWYLY
jgi:hypothetical protein